MAELMKMLPGLPDWFLQPFMTIRRELCSANIGADRSIHSDGKKHKFREIKFSFWKILVVDAPCFSDNLITILWT